MSRMERTALVNTALKVLHSTQQERIGGSPKVVDTECLSPEAQALLPTGWLAEVLRDPGIITIAVTSPGMAVLSRDRLPPEWVNQARLQMVRTLIRNCAGLMLSQSGVRLDCPDDVELWGFMVPTISGPECIVIAQIAGERDHLKAQEVTL